MSDASNVAAWFQEWYLSAKARGADHAQALHETYQRFENANLISKVTVHRYHCGKCGKPCATVIRVGGRTLARTRDYKFSSGYNTRHSVESARAQRTLDGDRHWPGHTYDVDELAADEGLFEVNCRHMRKRVLAADVLTVSHDVTPGQPGKPTML